MTVDTEKGVMDRFRSMPMAPSAIVVGRSLADMVNARPRARRDGRLRRSRSAGAGTTGSAARWRRSACCCWLRFAFQWVGIFLGLLDPDARRRVAAMQGLLFPVTMLTSAFVAPELMPGWLGTIAEWNPLSSTVTATRDLFGNPGWPAESWVAEHALALAVAWPAR